MAIKPIEEMTRPVSRKEETKMAMSSYYGIPITPGYRRQMLLDGYGSHRHGYSDDELRNMDDDAIREIYDELNEMFRDAKLKQPRDIRRVNQEGIMQLAGGFSGDDIIQSAMMWAIETEFGSMEELERQLRTGESTIPGIIAAYQDAIVDMN